MADPQRTLTKLRIDKWLWAARFFKTRTLAKSAIEGGKVHIEGARVKVSKEISVGAVISVRQGYDEREIRVLGLSEERRGAAIAQSLYEETERSIARRTREAEARRAAGAMARPGRRPGKHERQQLIRLRKHLDADG